MFLVIFFIEYYKKMNKFSGYFEEIVAGGTYVAEYWTDFYTFKTKNIIIHILENGTKKSFTFLEKTTYNISSQNGDLGTIEIFENVGTDVAIHLTIDSLDIRSALKSLVRDYSPQDLQMRAFKNAAAADTEEVI